jgi:prepilin-type N-terminal cleavage/methylation domain-containing protein
MTRSSSKAPHAFSLVEMVIVVVIAGTLAALAAPRYLAALHRYRVDAAARRIAADVALAQTRARASGAARAIAFDPANSTYRLAGESDLNRTGAAYVVELGRDPYHVSIGTVDFGGGATLSFNGFGVPASHGLVQVRCGSERRSVTVQAVTGATAIQ